MRAPECGVANPVRARTVAPRALSSPSTAHQPFANAAKAVVKIPSCGRASKARRIRPKILFWPKPFLFAREKAGKPLLYKQNGKPITSHTHNRPLKCTFPLRLPQTIIALPTPPAPLPPIAKSRRTKRSPALLISSFLLTASIRSRKRSSVR